jgi:hypothetical protein
VLPNKVNFGKVETEIKFKKVKNTESRRSAGYEYGEK